MTPRTRTETPNTQAQEHRRGGGARQIRECPLPEASARAGGGAREGATPKTAGPKHKAGGGAHAAAFLFCGAKETQFVCLSVVPPAPAPGHPCCWAPGSCFGLRWFTPTSEVPLCGHATLASAAVLFQIKRNVNSTLTFVTLSGELKARQAGDHITLDLPLYFSHPQDFQEVKELVKIAASEMAVQDVRYSPETKKLLVRLSDVYERSDLEKLKVNTQELLLAEKTGKIKGLIVTLKGDCHEKQGSYDFFSRYFAPWYGVSEDPVTGAAHTVLSSYWSQQLGKKEMCAFQCSARGGRLKILLRDDGRLDLSGQTAIVLKGFLTI